MSKSVTIGVYQAPLYQRCVGCRVQQIKELKVGQRY
jgi:hypothetical protein